MRISIDKETEEEKIEDKITEEERVDDDEEEEERVGEEEERVDDNEERIEDEEEIITQDELSIRDSTSVIMRTIKNAILKEKRIQILLILSRFEHGITLSRIASEIGINHQYARLYLKELINEGFVTQYRVYPDKRVYYKLTSKGKENAEIVHKILKNW